MSPSTFISMDLFQWLTIGLSVLMLLFGGGLLVGLIKLVSIGQDIRTTVQLIMGNHLPHIEAEIKEVRDMFIQHLEENTHGRR